MYIHVNLQLTSDFQISRIRASIPVLRWSDQLNVNVHAYNHDHDWFPKRPSLSQKCVAGIQKTGYI